MRYFYVNNVLKSQIISKIKRELLFVKIINRNKEEERSEHPFPSLFRF